MAKQSKVKNEGGRTVEKKKNLKEIDEEMVVKK